MKEFEDGFLALILTGVLMMVIGIGLMVATVRSPDGRTVLAEHRVDKSLVALPLPERRSAPPTLPAR